MAEDSTQKGKTSEPKFDSYDKVLLLKQNKKFKIMNVILKHKVQILKEEKEIQQINCKIFEAICQLKDCI